MSRGGCLIFRGMCCVARVPHAQSYRSSHTARTPIDAVTAQGWRLRYRLRRAGLLSLFRAYLIQLSSSNH